MTSKRQITVAGESVWLCGMSGTVAGDKKWSESHIRSHTHIAPSFNGNNPVVATSVSSMVNTRHEFWIVAPDGEERSVELLNSKISVREGQVVTVIWGAGARRDKGPDLILRNNNAQSDHWLVSGEKEVLHRMGLSDPFLLFAFAGFGAAFFFWILFHTWLLPTAVFVGGVVFGFHKRTVKARAVKVAIAEAMNLEVRSFDSATQNRVSAAGAGMLES